jgi:hypothetical protein
MHLITTPSFDPSAASSSRRANWAELLASLSRALEQAVAQVEQRLQALAAGNGPRPESGAEIRRAQEQVAGRWQQHQDGAARAEQAVAEVDGILAAMEDGLRDWLAATQANRRKLACGPPQA